MKTVSITSAQVAGLIASTRGKFFTVFFTKKDGTSRKMTARTGVTAKLRGGSTTYTSNPKNIGCYEMAKKEYRCFNAERVTAIKFGGVIYKVVGGL